MAFGIPGIRNYPQHSNWTEALAAGTAEATQRTLRLAGRAITGIGDCQGKPVKVDRMDALKVMGPAIAQSYDRHTLSVRNPRGYQQWKSAMQDFTKGNSGSNPNR